MKALQHLKTINHHKWLVCQGCFKVGLYKQGLLHDLSKYYSTDLNEGIIGMKMPVRYVVEMFIDRVAASKNYMKEKYTNQAPLEYYEKGAARLGKMIHPETAELLHQLLKMLAEEGEEKTCSYIRKYVLKNKK